ncbi:MAG: DUF4384 domain-containing protein [Bacteroidota bacterium]
MRTSFLFIVILNVFMSSMLWGQRWYQGQASVIGGETEAIGALRQRALEEARVNILRQAGINVQATEIRLQGESKLNAVDMYGSFAQSTARGIIIDERNLNYSSQFVTVDKLSFPQITATLEALVEIPKGDPDPAFEVSLITDKNTYYEGEELQMTVQSSKDGYLSIFQIKNDSCFILHPNPLLSATYDNKIAANTKIFVPPEDKPYSYVLDLEGGNGERAMEFIIAVVTIKEIPIGGRFNKKGFFSLKEFNNWLIDIAVDQRSSASIVVQIVKK